MAKRKTLMLTRLQGYWPDVRVIQDATRQLQVDLTSEDIRLAKPQDVFDCAVAVACRREYGVSATLVFRTRAFLLDGTTAWRFVVPIRTREELIALDRGGKMLPGTYYLDPPKLTNRLGRNCKRPKAAARPVRHRTPTLTPNMRPTMQFA